MKRCPSLIVVYVSLFLLGIPLIASRVSAQTVNGTLLGTIQDQQGGVIPGATVTTRNLDMGTSRTATADESGAYRIVGVTAGPYELVASATSFKTQVRTGIKVSVGSSIKVDFVLEVGRVAERVTVSGGAPQVDTSTSTMGGLVNDVTIRELPLNGRDWLQLAVLQPGAVFSPTELQSDVERLPRGDGMYISISGGRPTDNAYLLDGLIINDHSNASPGSALWVDLGVDAIREFSVLTNTYPAEYGRGSGGVINAITKSGGNEIHGTAFEFLRNSALDARNFFDLQIPPFRRNQFGGSLGGPIRKDKTFFFVNHEGLRELESLSYTSNTLSPNARNGILTTGPVSIDPRIQPYLALYPIPNGPITGDTGKFIFGGGRPGSENFVVGRIDHVLSEKTTLNTTYRFDSSQVSDPDAFNEKLTSAQTRPQDFIVDFQHIFSPSLLDSIRTGVTRTWATEGADVQPRTPLLTDPSLSFLPGIPVGQFTVPGLNTFGGIGATGADVVGYTTAQVYDDLSWTRGRHSLRMGFGFERIDDNVNPQTEVNGTWVFNSIAGMLTAKPTQFTAAVPGTDTSRGFRSAVISSYLQDDFRFRPNLTFNLGVRYETSEAIKEANGKIGNLLNLADAQPKVGNPLFLNPTLRNFEPRVGFAWDPFKNGKTSIRAGFGIYDILPLPYLFWNKATHGLPYFQLGVVSNPPSASFPSDGLSLLVPGSLRVASIQYQPKRPYKTEWNLNVERQLAQGISLMVGYVGSASVHVPVGQNDADQVPPSLTTVGPDGQILFPTTGKIPRINPNFGRIDSMLWYGHASYQALQTNLTKRMSHGLSFQATYTWAKSIDNGSTFFSDNETANTADPPYVFGPRINRGVSDFDFPQNAAINLLWDIPSASSLKGVSGFLLSGWELGGIFTVESGAPFNVGLTNDQARTGTSSQDAQNGQRPNLNPGCSDLVTGDPANYINAACFSFPALGTFGNLGRNALRGPALQDLDFALFKNVWVKGERLKIQFRAETFNILNHPNFGVQTVTLFDGTGKLIPTATALQSPTSTTSRQIQLGMKFIW